MQSSYQRFKRFVFSILLKEFNKLSGQLPGILTRKNWDLIIKFQAKSELEKRYCQEVQSLCRSPCFRAAKTEPRVINQHFLDEIIDISSKKAHFFCSLVLDVRATSYSSSFSFDLHLVRMKIVAVLVILCQLAHQNNSNYFYFLLFYTYTLPMPKLIPLSHSTIFAYLFHTKSSRTSFTRSY